MKARDSEEYLGQWAREGVPVGMDKNIPESGIFPQVEPDDVLQDKTDMSILADLKNYDQICEEGILQNPPIGGAAHKIPGRDRQQAGLDSETEAAWLH